MTQSIASEQLPDGAAFVLNPRLHCLFLDFDGTLVEFADHPDSVVLPGAVHADILRIHRDLGGAVAVVSGREIEVLDRFLAPDKLPVAGVHGLMRRDGSGRVQVAPFDAQMLERLHGGLAPFVAAHEGLILERKPGSVALHFRIRPELEQASQAAMTRAIAEASGGGGRFHVMQGKMVVEARASMATKAGAIAAFMDEPPFAGRIPVFAGDDVTDEDGFVEVNARGGVSIKVGAGATLAQLRIESVSSFHNWLASCLR